MGLFSKQPTFVVHDGRFHADDIFAVAVVRLYLKKKGRIIRTRDMEIIKKADYVMDVGGVYDPATHRFDHHQHGGAGARPDGTPYAAFGLVWKEYGAAIAGSPEIAARIDTRLVAPIDSEDNGVSVAKPVGALMPYTIQSFLYLSRPTWREDAKGYDTAFVKMVEIAEDILVREISVTRDYLLAEENVVRDYNQATDKRIVILEDRYPYQEFLVQFPEPLYVIIPNANKTQWKVEAVPATLVGFQNRKSLPKAWAGLLNDELVKMTGVEDALFCHNALFLAAAKTKEGALALATLALKD